MPCATNMHEKLLCGTYYAYELLDVLHEMLVFDVLERIMCDEIDCNLID